MKVTRIDQPAPTFSAQTKPTAAAASARDRAIAALTGNAPPVDNTVTPATATAIQDTKEELSGAQPQAEAQVEVSGQDSGQVDTQTAEVPPPEEKKDQTLSNQYNVLARKERALRAKQQQLNEAMRTREAALAAKEAELQAKIKEYETGYVPKSRLKSETLSVLAEEGLSYDELTQQILNQAPPNPQVDAHIKRLESQIKRLEQANEEFTKSQTASQTAQYQAAIKQIRSDVTNLVKTDPSFETIKATNSVSDVVELIEKTYKEDGILLSVEEASQEVENYLVEEAMKLARIGKIRSRLAPSPAAAAKANTQTPSTPKQPQPIKTLTNATGSTRQLTARERAVLAFEGRLKS